MRKAKSKRWPAPRATCTERKNAEDVLRESKEMIELAMRGGRMGTWVRDLTDHRVHWSADLEALFGLDPGSFEGSESAFFELVHPEDRATLEKSIAQALEQKTHYTVQFRVRSPGGGWNWMEGRGRAVYDFEAAKPCASMASASTSASASASKPSSSASARRSVAASSA